MKNHSRPKRWSVAAAALLLGAGLVLAGCTRKRDTRWQGYLEGEFVYVGSPISGQLEMLLAEKGQRVEARAPLFALERNAELAAQRQAAEQLVAAQARLEDLRKGSRPTEIAALEAQVEQLRVGVELARNDLQRIETLHQTNVVSESDYDRARLNHERAVGALDQLNAQLATARLGGRTDAITAAEAEARSAEALKQKADWSVEQKSQSAPRAGLVYDTLFRQGEFVPAGNPVVALLAPELLKVRFFVPEAEFSRLKAGDQVQVSLTNRPALAGRISYMSPKPEYTPPVLYNRENRAKLVFMVEATLSAADARDLHPGQPVDVNL
ncbi:MAG: HlyD family efflux transporter periplasmic adaptor subunit [Opitutus sp.]